jgi:group II intron reverse transcriptase/maturase
MKEQRFLPTMSPGLVRVAEAAQRNRGRLLSLSHHIDVEALRRAYARLRGNAAVGVDGVSKREYGESLEENLQDLHERLKTKRYRHQPIRRVYIDKEGGKKRPLGVSCTEDKVVQDSLRELLQAVYEQDFLPCSHGFRPRRNAHDALRALDKAVHGGGANWVLEADIVSCFDRIDRKKLMELLQRRCADKSLLRLIGKCLHVGILEDGGVVSPETGTTQGSTLSPLLANVYLHYVLDLWFEDEVKAKLQGKATLIRYADDFVIAFGRKEEAQQVLRWLVSRMAEYGLELHPEKTRLIDFRCPPPNQRGGKGPGTFDFLGFTVLWSRSRRGNWYMATQSRVSRLRRARKAIHAWCKSHRHLPIEDQHAALVRRIRGHFNYFDVRGNIRRMRLLIRHVERSWYKWLNRRSQRSTMSWKRFKDLLRSYPLPVPKSRVVLWGSAL